MFLEKGKNR